MKSIEEKKENCNTYKSPINWSTCVQMVSQRGENEAESIFKELIKDFPKLMKDISRDKQDKCKNIKPTIFKLLKPKSKEQKSQRKMRKK